MRINAWNTELGQREAQAAYDAIMSRHLSEGELVKELETKIADFLGVKYVICVPNGSSALLLALMGVGIQPGDEVVVPDFTFIATGHAPKLLGAKVILSDVQRDRPLLDIDKALELITTKTKAIIPVDLNGRKVNISELKEKLGDKNIYIVEDSCQAFASGEKGSFAGNQADIACYSFAVTKLMTTAQGGFVSTNSDTLYEKMKLLKMQGMNNIFESDVYSLAGFNLKYTDILASIGLVQFDRLSEKIEATKRNYEMYCEVFNELDMFHTIPTMDDEVVYTPDILCDDSKETRKYLEGFDIQIRPAGGCLHKASYFSVPKICENAKWYEEHLLYMPGGPNQPVENIKYVIDRLKEKSISK